MSEDQINKEKLYKEFELEAIPHMDALYNFALKLTTKEDDANDLVQDTYLKAFRFFHSFEKGTNCKAWLYRILKNTFINDYRKVSKQPDKVDYEDVQNFYDRIKATEVRGSHVEVNSFDNLLDDDLTEALSTLPEDFRTVIILCDIEGFNYEEIADFIDCPIGTVRSRLHRARKLLYSKLQDYAEDKGLIKKTDDKDE